jgi:L-fuconolactonase
MTPLVDANLHVVAPPGERARFPLAPHADETADHEATGIDELAEVMDGAGVGQALLFSSRHHGLDNSYCAEAAARYPARFAGVANIDITRPGALDDVRHWIDGRGMRGVRLWGGNSFFTDRRAAATWLGDRQLDPLWETLRSRGIPCNAHKTFPDALPATLGLLQRFDGLRLTLNNLAHIPADQGTASEELGQLLALARFRDVYVTFSVDFAVQAADPRAPERQVLGALLDGFGSGRLCWSAFYPSLRQRRYATSVALVREALSFLPVADQEQILGGAARSLYPCLASPGRLGQAAAR